MRFYFMVLFNILQTRISKTIINSFFLRQNCYRNYHDSESSTLIGYHVIKFGRWGKVNSFSGSYLLQENVSLFLDRQ